MQNFILFHTLAFQIGPSNMLFTEKKRFVAIAISILLVSLFFCFKVNAQCSQNNFAVPEIYFLDDSGQPIDPTLQTIGSRVQGRIYARFSGSANNAFFPLHFAYTEEVGGVSSPTTSTYCVMNSTGTSSNQIPKNELVYLFDYEITWGSETFFKNIYMTWRTNDGRTACRTSDASGQCYSSPEGLKISVEFSQLPVVWADVSATINNKNQMVYLGWSTVKEWESSHFEIERSIDDIENFTKIGSVSSVGWSEGLSTYEFWDEKPPLHAKRFYYRVRQIDFDGTTDYSKTILVNNPFPIPVAKNWQVFPNPLQSESLQLKFNGKNLPEEIIIRIYNFNHSKSYRIEPAFGNIAIGHLIEDFPKGVLIIEVVTKVKVETHKILKK
ncbi:hypothetical protein CLV48_105180 [Cecembia rubra]|uniref:Uncharacterized protein n=2 Tax=Cecembia rubra TaxID=1485585 RepID=A0A2P8E4P0_9BACT|nr:hypothetical protein CLV48_105180 [Cecembia rubra]